jgi:hypothetical protein
MPLRWMPAPSPAEAMLARPDPNNGFGPRRRVKPKHDGVWAIFKDSRHVIAGLYPAIQSPHLQRGKTVFLSIHPSKKTPRKSRSRRPKQLQIRRDDLHVVTTGPCFSPPVHDRISDQPKERQRYQRGKGRVRDPVAAGRVPIEMEIAAALGLVGDFVFDAS